MEGETTEGHGGDQRGESRPRQAVRYIGLGLLAALAAYPKEFTASALAGSVANLLVSFVIAVGLRWLYQRIREKETPLWSPWVMVLTGLVVVLLMFPDRRAPSEDRPVPNESEMLALFALPGYEFFEPPEDVGGPLEEEIESAESNPDVEEAEARGVTGPDGQGGFVVIGTLDPDELDNQTLSGFAFSLSMDGPQPEVLEIEKTTVYSLDLQNSLHAFTFIDYHGMVLMLMSSDKGFLRQLSGDFIEANAFGVPKSV
jgi:hypothetical protein